MIKNTILLLLLVISSCGIFQPRDSFEVPEPKVLTDRFNFTDIFKNAGKRFAWKSLDALFCDTLQYSDMKSGSYGKKKLIDHLQQIELQYPNFTVIWGSVTISSEESNMINISNVPYTIIYDSTAVDGVRLTGTSIMEIRGGDYKIAKWYDFPDGEQESFFTPLD